MTLEEFKQLEEIFKPVKSIDDIKDIEHDISTLNNVLSTVYLDESTTCSLIKTINIKHPDNRVFYILLNPPTGSSIHIDHASADCLKQDLLWKKTYLSIKAAAKTLDEIIHRLQNLYHRNL